MPLEKIIQRIEEESKREADSIIEEARKRADEILGKAKEEAKGEKEKIMAKGKEREEQLWERARSSARRDVKRMEMEAKEEVIAECFERAREKLASLKGRDYEKVVRNLIEHGKGIVGDCIIIPSRKEDEKIAKKMGMTIANDEIEALGGVIIRSIDGKVTMDNTFDGILERRKEEIRKKVGLMLFKEC